ncbi:7026_t:CDS:2 [Funneliformis mosseae]|uniref:7026_t:CDS:1 n=1 Tax=Funneliformis mosseae TaxID=27381 RepID=A0A9N8V1P6_FUNMO|nr:7026_t:CDS:2 [Funneliformis mosseae]
MVLRRNLEQALKDLETRIKELEQNNEGLQLQFNNLEEKFKEREETKTKQETINNLEEKRLAKEAGIRVLEQTLGVSQGFARNFNDRFFNGTIRFWNRNK